MSGDRQRATWTSWLRTLGTIAAVIAAFGGFNEAGAARRSAEPGTVVDAGRLHWTVHEVVLTETSLAGYNLNPSLRLTVTVLNTADATVQWLDRGLVALVLPDGSVLDEFSWRATPCSLAFQPGIPADAYVEVELDDPDAVAGGTVVVRIHDEVPYTGGITTETWQVDADATDVAVRVRDTRAP